MSRLSLSLAACFAFAPAARAQIFWPILHGTTPCAVQQGQTIECVVGASNNGSKDVYQVLVSGTGVTGAPVTPGNRKALAAPPASMVDARIPAVSLKVRFTAAADAPVGIRDVRVLSPHGPSSLGQIVIVRDPIIREADANDSMKEAQTIALPATLCGKIDGKQDVDYFKFKVAAGTSLTFHMYCQRLQAKLTSMTYHADPLLALRNADGTVLATNDNFFGIDPLLHYRFTTAGEYYLEVRDVRYLGYRSWDYAIEVNDRPFITTIAPACLPPNVPTKVRLLGYNLPADPYVTVTLPADAPPWDQWLPLPSVAGQPLNAVPVRPVALPIVHEAAAPNDTLAQAQPVIFPSAIAGVMERPADVDCYAFQAKKGERFSFQIAARPLYSELDSILRICDAKGNILAENDDKSDATGHPEKRNEILCADSRIENWEAPVDGRYVIQVSDVNDRGGERFTYALLLTRARPHFQMELSTDKTIISPTTTSVIFVRAIRREGFTGDIQLAVENLPPGVTAECGSIPAACQDGCIFLRAKDAKPRTFGNIRVVGSATMSPPGKPVEKLTALARPLQELMVDGGARYLVPVDVHAVFVADSLDLKAVKSSPGELTIKPGETKKIELTIERRSGFQAPVTLTLMSNQHVWVYGNCLPPGVTLDPASETRLAGNQLKATLILKASKDAKPVERQLVPVMATVAINFSLSIYFVGDPLRVTVKK